MDKRTLLTYTVFGTGTAIMAAAAVPAVIHMLSPLAVDLPSDRWRPIGSVDTFPIGKMSEAIVKISDEPEHSSLAERSIYVWRKTESEFIVFSRSCSDLGCPIVWDSGSEWFLCPCHGGIFDKEGERRAGPPKRGLYKYEYKVDQGELKINVLSVPPMV
ncbi:MAG: hypothetical protein EOP04_10670 [Proteobacteria bacterium]|nr:MAG: hypothetical protein EOP04_10670 [Pseudomonadota bacterium]